MRIQRKSLHMEAADRIRELIVKGELPPGGRIAERQMSERFGISRTPLREALKVLAVEGLVEITQNRGARVAQLSQEDLENTFQVMAALEALSGELACRHITDAELARIRTLHCRMVERYKEQKLTEYSRLGRQIHESIMAAANNPVLVQMYGGLAGRVQRSRYVASMRKDDWKTAIEDHEAIMEALEARDGERLGQILKEHLQHKLDTVLHSPIAVRQVAARAGQAGRA
ncbi:DNA-binding GntR family transcriptional regulator [Natronocella acetinitrilica]|uniref:DNA-binding GntR family transcriptional regulator n=1 Tax=Natronocella acetinitrilica TaxID=414046 RepID=A0AAE3G4Z3_9GAMM|nr:GntR family transcriptional regulator [Natronocella acetinitrilica]MCP1675744.1 DNA-binding GntR family transcriptional regulator [Natronocella acetinitrilica]